ncbi:hypothetical protein [Candidatus Ichthyocystis sparus]|uniref:hypothetical protein n=1 Tax=Candidatus Ichthyocystis sparus TaxID=1561004 RepID=UPI000B8865AC|nr:hypothetical protein [Candidatus Ichthyocystis sparus]
MYPVVNVPVVVALLDLDSEATKNLVVASSRTLKAMADCRVGLYQLFLPDFYFHSLCVALGLALTV